MTETKIRIMLVDRHPAIRQSWKMLLEHTPRFDVVADCDDSERATVLAKQLHPDILLIDLNLSPTHGFNLTEQITQILPDIKIIGISVNDHPRYANRMIELGARGYITKTSNMEEIVHGIEEVFRGNIFICAEIRKRMTD